MRFNLNKRVKNLCLILGVLVLFCFGMAFIGSTVKAESEKSLEIKYCNLAFEDNVYILYAVDSENVDNKEDIKLLIWREYQDDYNFGTQNTVLDYYDDIAISGKSYCMFVYDKLSAKEMTDDVYARPYYNDNGTAVYGEVKKYSILQYAHNKLKTSSNGELIDLLNTMLDYGTASQEYFGYKLGTLANDNYYEIKLFGGVLEDGFSSGLFKLDDEIIIKSTNEDFFSWTDEEYNTVGMGSPFCLKVEKDLILKARSVSKGLSFTAIEGGYEVSGIEDSRIKDIVIPENYDGKPVISIGEEAFFNSAITSVYLPDTVTAVKDRAFASCSDLVSIRISNNIKEFGVGVCSACWSLNTNSYDNAKYLGNEDNEYLILWEANNKNIGSCEINDNCKIISNGAFGDCYSLGNVSFPNGLLSIGASSFADCYSLTEVVIPDSVTGIEEGAFRLCESLKSVTVDKAVTAIKASAFSYCTNLKTVTFGDGVTNIEDDVFFFCQALTSVVIGNGVKSIGVRAFNLCSSLENLVIGNGVTEIMNNAFDSCVNLQSIDLHNSVQTLGNGAFSGCDKLATVSNAEAVKNIGANCFSSCPKLKSIEFTDKLETMGEYAFCECHELESVTLGNSLKFLGESAFENCWSLKGIVLPDRLTNIGDRAFSGCVSLADVKMGRYVTRIGLSAFMECQALVSITIPDEVEVIGRYAFDSCTQLKTVTLGKRVSSVELEAFNGCPIEVVYYLGTDRTWETMNVDGRGNGSLTEAIRYYFTKLYLEDFVDDTYWHYVDDVITVWERAKELDYDLIDDGRAYRVIGLGTYDDPDLVIPEYYKFKPVTSIKYEAFSFCDNITSVVVSDRVTDIGDSAFKSCSSLITVRLGKGVTVINPATFDGCEKLESVIFDGEVTDIGGYVFRNCISLKDINIPENLLSLGDEAFDSCHALTGDIKLNCLTKFGSAFYACNKITSVEVSEAITYIGDFTFANCSALSSVKLGGNIESIRSHAFEGCQNISKIYYNGTADGWAKIEISSDNDELNSVTICYYSESEPTIEGSYWHYDVDGKTIVEWTK